jgi:hypothetical protein
MIRYVILGWTRKFRKLTGGRSLVRFGQRAFLLLFFFEVLLRGMGGDGVIIFGGIGGKLDVDF